MLKRGAKPDGFFFHATVPKKVTVYIASPGKYTKETKGSFLKDLGTALSGIVSPR